ncbi:MAG: gamma-glutamyl-gamma-aminobutyrate hydrolase family protein [Actinomycetota bacterium]
MDTTGSWIAVIGQWRRGYARVPTPYLHAVELAGGRPRVLSTFELPDESPPSDEVDGVFGLDPHDANPLEGACGLLVPGGGDIDPEWYGAERHPRTVNISHRRDTFERTLLAAALDQDIPVLAVCHGMQLLNVHLGGTLVQHLADDPTRLNHDRDRPRAEPAHQVRVKKDSILFDALGPHAPVNSHHHQGLERVADGLEEIAWAEDDVLEAVVAEDHSWVVGVQWHPEAMAPVDHRELKIFEEFVAASEMSLQQQRRRSA